MTSEYRLEEVPFQPDVFYDIGAHHGTVSLLAASLFPAAKIVAVEPDSENYQQLVRNTEHLPNIIPLKRALATKQVRRSTKTTGSMHHIFVDSSSALWSLETFSDTEVAPITLDSLYAQHGGERYIVKLDCEGGELMIFDHAPSMNIVEGASWIGAEFHLWSLAHKPSWWSYGMGHDSHAWILNTIATWLHRLSLRRHIDVRYTPETMLVVGREKHE